MFKKIIGTIAIGALGVALYYGAAFSTPPSGQTNTSILVGTFDQLDVKKSGEARVTVKTKEDVDIVSTTDCGRRLHRVAFAPGAGVCDGDEGHPDGLQRPQVRAPGLSGGDRLCGSESQDCPPGAQ